MDRLMLRGSSALLVPKVKLVMPLAAQPATIDAGRYGFEHDIVRPVVAAPGLGWLLLIHAGAFKVP
jgi:hypothetical protein